MRPQDIHTATFLIAPMLLATMALTSVYDTQYSHSTLLNWRALDFVLIPVLWSCTLAHKNIYCFSILFPRRECETPIAFPSA